MQKLLSPFTPSKKKTKEGKFDHFLCAMKKDSFFINVQNLKGKFTLWIKEILFIRIVLTIIGLSKISHSIIKFNPNKGNSLFCFFLSFFFVCFPVIRKFCKKLWKARPLDAIVLKIPKLRMFVLQTCSATLRAIKWEI